MIMRFSGKLVIVAGGTGGLGRAVSLAFLQEGAKVVVTYRDQKEFDVLESERARMACRSRGTISMSPTKRRCANFSTGFSQHTTPWTPW